MTLMTVPMKGATHSTRGPSGPTLAGWFHGRYAAAAPATWNRELATLRAAVGWWRRRGWLAADLTDGRSDGPTTGGRSAPSVCSLPHELATSTPAQMTLPHLAESARH